MLCFCAGRMTNAEQQRQDILNAIADDPVTFTFNETDYTGTRGVLKLGEEFIAGGVLAEPALSLLICLQDGAGNDVFEENEPANGHKITVDDVDYQVKMVTEDQWGVALQIDLESSVR